MPFTYSGTGVVPGATMFAVSVDVQRTPTHRTEWGGFVSTTVTPGTITARPWRSSVTRSR